MKNSIKILLAVAAVFAMIVAVGARPSPEASRARVAKAAADDNEWIDVGNLGVLVTNYGKIGDESTPRQTSFEWPLGSNNDHLYAGRVWFGALATKGDVSSLIGVSSGDQDDWGTEPASDSYAIRNVEGDSARGDYDTYATYTDVFTGGKANAIGIRVDQHTSTWTVSYLDDVILYDLTFTNESGVDIYDAYTAVAFDGDISSQEGAENYLDDLTYYFHDADLGRFLSYEYDWDHPEIPGRDIGGPEGQSRGFLGTSPLLVIDAQGNETTLPATHYWWDWNHDPGTDQLQYEYMASEEYLPVPASAFDYRYMQAYGPFDIPAGQSVRVLSVHGVGLGLEGLRENVWAIHDLFEANRAVMDAGKWAASGPPASPDLTVEPGNKRVRLLWGDSGEDHVDAVTGVTDFAGYRIWKSPTGVEGTWTLLADFDQPDEYGLNSGLPPVVESGQYAGMYEFEDTQVKNGFSYYYAVTVYDKGDLEAVGSLESSTNTNKIEVLPGPVGDTSESPDIYVYPNPYRFQATWDPTPGPQAPEANRVRFNNIPGQCKIRVYTMSGDLVSTLNHTDGTGYHDWQLMSDRANPQKVVSGLYLYSVRGEGVDFVGKFVILR
jgi:hypothetical protein